MVTIEAKASVRGHTISWLFDGEDEDNAVTAARANFKSKGLRYLTYILV